MSDLRDRTGAKFSWIALAQREAPGSTNAEPKEAVVEAANLGSTWGWPQIQRPVGPRHTEVERDGGEPAPARPEAGQAGGVALTREHLEQWIDRGASRPMAPALGAPVRDAGEPQGGAPRRVPAHDILFVGRLAPKAAAANGSGRAITARFPSIRGDRSNVSAGFGESAWHPGSPRRLAVLSVVLAGMLIWAAHANHLLAPSVIEVPTTLNSLSRIT